MLTKDIWGKFLLIEVVLMVFVIGFLPEGWQSYAYSTLFTLMIFTSVFNLDTHQRFMLRAAIIVFTMEWVSSFFNLQVLIVFSNVLKVLFFIVVGAYLIVQIAKAKEVDAKVIFEAINGYLLLGIIFSILIILIILMDSNAFNFSSNEDYNINDSLYYGFVTLSTLGYGDLVPLTKPARSVALITTLGGQLYLAIIIALLVGKFSSGKKPS